MSKTLSNIDMDMDSNIIKERSTLSSKTSFRNSLVFSSTSSTSYHKHMKLNNNFLEDESQEPIDSSQLFYASQVDIDESVKKVTDKILLMRGQYISNKELVLITTSTL